MLFLPRTCERCRGIRNDGCGNFRSICTGSHRYMLPWEEFGGMTCQILLLGVYPVTVFPWSRFLSSLRDCEVEPIRSKQRSFSWHPRQHGRSWRRIHLHELRVSHGINVRQGLDYPCFGSTKAFKIKSIPLYGLQ